MTDFDKDTWQTPGYIELWLYRRYKINVDGCATEENYLFSSFIGASPNQSGCQIHHDFLAEDLDRRLQEKGLVRANIFVNPPYSDVTPFIQQAKRLRDHGHLVVMLLNNDKSTQWYQNHIHNVANEVIDIIGGRIAFIHPITGNEIKGNSKGQMVVVFDPTMEDFVQRSVSLDFIKTVGGYEKI